METPPIEANLVEHFPPKEALDLAGSVEAGLEAFKNGEVILRHLSTSHLRTLLGLNAQGEPVDTGLRFTDTLDGEDIESHPNFAGRDPLIDKNDPSDTSRGVAKVTTSSGEHNIDLIVNKYGLGSEGTEYSLTLIPGASMTEDLRQKYFSLLTAHIKKGSGV